MVVELDRLFVLENANRNIMNLISCFEMFNYDAEIINGLQDMYDTNFAEIIKLVREKFY